MDSTILDLEQRIQAALRKTRQSAEPGSEPEVHVETTEGDEGEKEAQPLAKPIHINLFQHPDAHPIALDVALLIKYGPEWMTWEPEVLELRIPQDFRTSSISDLNLEKVQAVKTLHLVDTFWESWEVFLWCTMPFNDAFPDFARMQVPTVAQCLVSVDIANRIRTDVSWSQEIKTYLATVWRFGNLFCPLPPVDFIDVEVPEVVDCDEVQKRWPEVRASDERPAGGTIIGEQLRRMQLANDYLEYNRERLRRQMSVVNDV